MTSQPAPPADPDDWTGPRAQVSGAPVAIGAVVIGLVLVSMIASLAKRPGLPSRLSQDYSAMMAGGIAAEIQTGDPAALAAALARQGLPFTPRVGALEPEFVLLGGRRHDVDARRGAAWFYRAPSAELAIAQAFEGTLEDLGPSDERRAEGPRPLHIYRKTTQTIVCWQEGDVVYVFTSTLPGEVVIGLAKRLAPPLSPAATQ